VLFPPSGGHGPAVGSLAACQEVVLDAGSCRACELAPRPARGRRRRAAGQSSPQLTPGHSDFPGLPAGWDLAEWMLLWERVGFTELDKVFSPSYRLYFQAGWEAVGATNGIQRSWPTLTFIFPPACPSCERTFKDLVSLRGKWEGDSLKETQLAAG